MKVIRRIWKSVESFPFRTNSDEKLGRAWLGFVDASFVLALPFRHGDLEPECVAVSTRGGASKKREVERCCQR